MTESCELLARAPVNPLKCRQYEYFWTQILPINNSVEVGVGRWFGNNSLLSGNMETNTCSHITHIQLQHDQRESPVYLRIHRNTSSEYLALRCLWFVRNEQQNLCCKSYIQEFFEMQDIFAAYLCKKDELFTERDLNGSDSFLSDLIELYATGPFLICSNTKNVQR